MAGEIEAKVKLNTSEFTSGINEIKKVAGEAAGSIGEIVASASAAAGAAIAAAATGISKIVTDSVKSFGEYEQLVGGAKKIFDEMDYSKIAEDANNAWMTMNLSASQYLAMINDVGASFAATMGDQQGYEVAKQGMQAIADYASGTGKNVDVLSEKFAMITRAASSYQSIADQFSGILPATSADFLEQAQAAGFLSSQYKKLTDVPVAEYQQAVSAMLEKGVKDLGLAGNTAAETMNTLTGSIAGLKSAWENLMTGMADSSANLGPLIDNVVTMAQAALENIIPVASQALEGISTVIANIAPVIAAELPGLVSTVAPQLLDAAVSIVNTLTAALPGLIQSITSSLTSILPQFAETVVNLLNTLASDIVPSLFSFAVKVIITIGQAVADNAQQMAASLFEMVNTMVSILSENMPAFITVAVQILSVLSQSLVENLPLVISSIVTLIISIAQTIIDNLPTIIVAGLQIILAIVNGIVENMNYFTDSLIMLIGKLATTIMDNLPLIIEAGLQIGLAIVKGILLAIPSLLVSIGRFLGIVDDASRDFGKSTEAMTDSTKTMGADIGMELGNIENSFSSFSSNIAATTSGVSSVANSMASDVKTVTVPVYDAMGNLVRSFEVTQSTAQSSAENISTAVSSAQNTTQASTEKIIEGNSKIMESCKQLNDIIVKPKLDATNLQHGYTQVETICNATISVLNNLGSMIVSPNVDPSGVEDGCSAIAAACSNAIGALTELSGTSASPSVTSIGARASGGPVSAGSPYVVGEEGPELFMPRSNGYILNADDTEDLFGRSGDRSIVINVNGDVYDDEMSMRRKMKAAVLDVIEMELAYG